MLLELTSFPMRCARLRLCVCLLLASTCAAPVLTFVRYGCYATCMQVW